MDNIEEAINFIDKHEKERTRNLLFKYIKKWPWFLIFCTVGFITGYLFTKNSPELFLVKSRILIINEDNSINNFLPFENSIINLPNSNIENQIGILRSYTLYRKALDNLNWDYSWYKKQKLYNADLYNNQPFILSQPPNAINAQDVPIEIQIISDLKYRVNIKGETVLNNIIQKIDISEEVEFGQPFTNHLFNFSLEKRNAEPNQTYILVFNNLNNLTNEYLANTQINVEEENSDIITVSLEGEVKQKDADFINELNDVFIQFGMQNKYNSSEKSIEFIDSQLLRIKRSLDNAEETFSTYRRNNQVMNLGQEAQIVYSRLEEIEQEQYLTDLQIDYYKDLLQYIDDSKKMSEMLNPSIIGITDASLTSLLTRLTELHSRREVLSYSVEEKNPTYIVLQKEIKIARDGLEETIRNQLKTTQSQKESLEERYDKIQGRLRSLPETERNLIGIQREFDLNNDLYNYMLERKAEASITKASIAPQVQIIDAALTESAVRVGPNLVTNLAVGIAAGAIVPILFITLLGFFNNKIETREEVENGTNIPVLEGIIKHRYKSNLPVIQYPRSGIAESFRGLKTNLNTTLDIEGTKIISINSLIPGEGKSFISSNLSAILAKNKQKVLLIGADLHRPTLHRFFNQQEKPGLSSYLNDEKCFNEIIYPTDIPNLMFIQAGKVTDNPSDLFSKDKFELLIKNAREDYDYIIIDNAPLLLIPDAILTNHFSEISLFILRINYSHKKQINQIAKIVKFNMIKRSSIVVNSTTNRSYEYGYGHKYWKKGYGEYKFKMSIA
ncbi:polysaccharide biosynthesis tyrosine autokinase [uncultured Draconibacterium sp.]|uniref:GumC family protein n=1 Tax=uncultured Draconibacterium sp. TaxID=1573823 RepID=UPI002AA8211F|nr:polysaccharide biosynthesis tyrosine autokinase [uncultured Draconibacterium sp.]